MNTRECCFQFLTIVIYKNTFFRKDKSVWRCNFYLEISISINSNDLKKKLWKFYLWSSRSPYLIHLLLIAQTEREGGCLVAAAGICVWACVFLSWLCVHTAGFDDLSTPCFATQLHGFRLRPHAREFMRRTYIFATYSWRARCIMYTRGTLWECEQTCVDTIKSNFHYMPWYIHNKQMDVIIPLFNDLIKFLVFFFTEI